MECFLALQPEMASSKVSGSGGHKMDRESPDSHAHEVRMECASGSTHSLLMGWRVWRLAVQARPKADR